MSGPFPTPTHAAQHWYDRAKRAEAVVAAVKEAWPCETPLETSGKDCLATEIDPDFMCERCAVLAPALASSRGGSTEPAPLLIETLRRARHSLAQAPATTFSREYEVWRLSWALPQIDEIDDVLASAGVGQPENTEEAR